MQERMPQCVVFPSEEMRIEASCHAYPHSKNNKRTKYSWFSHDITKIQTRELKRVFLQIFTSKGLFVL